MPYSLLPILTIYLNLYLLKLYQNEIKTKPKEIYKMHVDFAQSVDSSLQSE